MLRLLKWAVGIVAVLFVALLALAMVLPPVSDAPDVVAVAPAPVPGSGVPPVPRVRPVATGVASSAAPAAV